MVCVSLESTLVANHGLVGGAVVLSNDVNVVLTQNPKHLRFLLQHLIDIISELLRNNDNLLIDWAH